MASFDPLSIYTAEMRVFGAPSRYVQCAGLMDHVGRFASQLGGRAVLVLDEVIWGLYGKRLATSLQAAEMQIEVLMFSGNLMQSTAGELTADLSVQDGDVVVAVGGGRAIDTGKAVVEILGCPLITVPTAASNDAATSKNFVLYDASKKVVEVRHLPRSPDFVLADIQVIAGAPKAYLAAGFGDAIAKLTEANACAQAGGVNMFGAHPPRTALAIAEACEETLLTHGVAAFEFAGSGQVTEAFDTCVEALLLMAGLAFENGGLSIAHALTRGLPLIREISEQQHGNQVAYGVLVQKMVENTEIDPRLLDLMRVADLPLSFRGLAGRAPSAQDFETIAQGTMGVPHLKNFPVEVSEKILISAMERLESAF